MKKGDFFVFGGVAGLLLLSIVFIPQKKGTTVKVMQNNKIVYEGSLDKDNTVGLTGNYIVIKDGEVYMKHANCKNGICVHTGKIHKKGESIICLPNRVSVEIE